MHQKRMKAKEQKLFCVLSFELQNSLSNTKQEKMANKSSNEQRCELGKMNKRI